ncbi:MAG: ATP-binding protein [Deltaproteobacteria bacterium]|jgi:hypothetical protein|nr:ATP-binding protein [Deltaproteobacteria bacterium]
MDAIADRLERDLKVDLTAIRSAVGGLPHIQARSSLNLVEQGNHMIACFKNWLLDDEQIHILSRQPRHLFVLYAAAYLIDIGLTDGSGPAGADLLDSLYTRSAELIRSEWQKLGIADASLADTIARVCLQVGNDDGSKPSAVAIAGAALNVSLLAACLQLARALDLTAAATLAQIYQHLQQKDRFAPEKLTDYFSVTDLGPNPYLNGTIRLRIQCSDPEVHRALKHHERSVQQELERMNQRVRPRFLYSDVIYEIKPEGYSPIDLKFSVDSSAGLQLFMGNRLYSDKRVFLRELIQNAVDACNYRRLFDDSYSPAISIEFSDDLSVIKIRDNGVGMTRQWIEKYFLAIGISFYQSSEIRNVNRDSRIDFGFISQFGIGFLSSFLVAEKIVIKTRKAGYAGLAVTISGLRDYFDVRALEEDFSVGTEVTLHLKASKMKYCRSLEFAGYLKTNIRFLKIPVSLKDEHGNTTTIGREQLAYGTAKSAGPVFLAPLNFDDAEGYLRLGAKNLGDHIHALETAGGGVSVFQDGIFVTQMDALLPEGARQHVVSRINLMGQDKCELSMDRNRMFWSAAQLQHIKKVIRHGLVDVANQLMAAVQDQDVPENTFNSIVNNLAIFFDFSDVDDVMYDQLCEPLRRKVEKRFRDFVRISYSQKQRAGGTVEADGYNETWQRTVLQSFVKD